jgi:nicotinamidase-related amidase
VAAEVRAAGGAVVIVRHGAAGRRRSSLPPVVGSDDHRLTFAPHPTDLVVDAAGVDGFHGGPLDDVLRARGVDQLVLGGFGHEAAVDSTLRSANDRGYECLVLTDGVAPFAEDTGAHALSSVTMSGGIFGALGTSADLVHALHSHTHTLEVVP